MRNELFLCNIADFVSDNIMSDQITIEQYVTTDSLMQNKNGRTVATNLPPHRCSLVHYKVGDILISNIRPYLRKIWYADSEGGASNDVLVFRAKSPHLSSFLFGLLSQEAFFDYVMLAAKGSKMPRGDKQHIMRYPISNFTEEQQEKIGKVFWELDEKIKLCRNINNQLEQTMRDLYDYWFLQFDFPDAKGNPYRSSGGAMTYNATLKREIPVGWEVDNLYKIANFTNGLACQKFRPEYGEKKLPVIKIGEMHNGISDSTEYVKFDIPEKVKVYDGDILFSWSASLEVMLWANGNGGLNQHIFKVTGNNGYPKSFVLYELKDYVKVFKKIAESRKTTMGHITSEHLQQSAVPLPPTLDIPNSFEEKVSPLLGQIVANAQESLYLTKLRDKLLPLLMNGQVTIE